MRTQFCIFFFLATSFLLVGAFQVPNAGHHHPLYIRYRQEQIEEETGSYSRSQLHSPCDIVEVEARGSATTYMEQDLSLFSSAEEHYLGQGFPFEDGSSIDASISTPISYDEETGMVQTAVRAIVSHPLSNIVDSSVVGLSSTLVIAFGALHEVVDCVELQLTHHASSTTEGLAILSLGHFFHYGREAIRQLVELELDESNPLSTTSAEDSKSQEGY